MTSFVWKELAGLSPDCQWLAMSAADRDVAEKLQFL